jgi:hypothetical protein
MLAVFPAAPRNRPAEQGERPMPCQVNPRLTGAALFALAALAIPAAAAADAPTKILYRFHGGADGFSPSSSLVADPAGNLYGTASYGGGTDCAFYEQKGCGIVFRLAPPAGGHGPWTETILHRFHGTADGAFPGTPLLRDATGTLYGVTAVGGGGKGVCVNAQTGCGTVFALAPPAAEGGAWTLSTLYVFQGGADGGLPTGLIQGATPGSFVGTTETGGVACSCGTVFSLAPPAAGTAWTETILYAFTGIPPHSNVGDGQAPLGVVYDAQGNLVGTTSGGGKFVGGEGGGAFGILFRLTPAASAPWAETILYRFGFAEQNPVSVPVIDAQGDIFGTTYQTAYEVVADIPVPIHIFREGTPTGFYPFGGVTPDASGNLVGTTLGGGIGHGLVFRLEPPASPSGRWHEHVLHSFAGTPDGDAPAGPVTLIGTTLFGTTLRGGSSGCDIDGGVGCGTVFGVALPRP